MESKQPLALFFFLLLLVNKAAGVRDLPMESKMAPEKDDNPIAGGKAVSIPNEDETPVPPLSTPPRKQEIVSHYSKSPLVTVQELNAPDKPDLPSCLPNC